MWIWRPVEGKILEWKMQRRKATVIPPWNTSPSLCQAFLSIEFCPDSLKGLKYPEYWGKLCLLIHLEVLQQISVLLIEKIPEKQTPAGGLQFQCSHLEDRISTGAIYYFHRLTYTPSVKALLPLVEKDRNKTHTEFCSLHLDRERMHRDWGTAVQLHCNNFLL